MRLKEAGAGSRKACFLILSSWGFIPDSDVLGRCFRGK